MKLFLHDVLLWIFIFLWLSVCSPMIRHQQSAAKTSILANLSHASTYWKASIPYDRAVGIHDMISRFNVTNDVLLYQLSRLAGTKRIPVVFICYSRVPKYLHHTIEIASRLNPVILLNNMYSEPAITSLLGDTRGIPSMPVFYIPMSYRKLNDVSDFENVYEAIYLDTEHPARQEFEKKCFLRWILLANLVSTFNLPSIFYADNDVVVTGNLTTAIAVRRDTQRCDVVLSVVGDQATNLEHWIGHFAGHSSFWTQEALQDWKDFLMSMYHSHKDTLRLTGHSVSTSNGRNKVVDQTLLFLYFVSHHLGSAMWDAGRPQSLGTGRLRRSDKQMQDVWSRYDFKFKQARDSFSLPRVSDPSLVVCSGLDVIDRSCFDHKHAFYSNSFVPNINASIHHLLSHYQHRDHTTKPTSFQDQKVHVHDPLTHFLPHITGLTSFYGGRAETFDAEEVKTLDKSRLYFYSLHYEGISKNWIPLDGCRRLVSRTQYYLEHYYRSQSSELEKMLEQSDVRIEEYMLSRFVDPMVLEDCQDVLKHRDNLPPYPDSLHD